jgi:hypothetical protein
MSYIGRDQAVVNMGKEFLILHTERGELFDQSRECHLRTDTVSSPSPASISETQTLTINVDDITIY